VPGLVPPPWLGSGFTPGLTGTSPPESEFNIELPPVEGAAGADGSLPEGTEGVSDSIRGWLGIGSVPPAIGFGLGAGSFGLPWESAPGLFRIPSPKPVPGAGTVFELGLKGLSPAGLSDPGVEVWFCPCMLGCPWLAWESGTGGAGTKGAGAGSLDGSRMGGAGAGSGTGGAGTKGAGSGSDSRMGGAGAGAGSG